jgi:hexulose-6-phosphate isomerase
MNAAARIGFMQGRLSPMVGGRIQAFPWDHWRDELPLAARHGFGLMEWTLDQDRLRDNPLMTESGQREIRALCAQHGITIGSLTGDCFMQAPLWKTSGRERAALEQDFRDIAASCAAIGIGIIVVPLVDAGALDNAAQEDDLVAFLASERPMLARLGVRVAFECDFAPANLARLIARFEPGSFGVNYDIGNSAALGFDAPEELAAYGDRVINVHIKDRVLGGITVPLGTGNARFEEVFPALARLRYAGRYILQTARAVDGEHAVELCRYRDMAAEWITCHGA